MVRITSRKSPSVFVNVRAILLTSASGGSSETKRMRQLFEMKCAVAGYAPECRSLQPVLLPPPAGNRDTEHVLLALVVHACR